MTKKIISVLFLLAATFLGATYASEDDSDYAIPSPYKITKAVKISILSASKKTDYDSAEDCTTFVVNENKVKFLLEKSRTVSKAYRMHQSDFSSCQAEGKVKFSNGDEADWTIQRGGIAFLSVSNGKFKDKVIILSCKKCEDWGI